MPLREIHQRFRVTCLPDAERVAGDWRPSHVVSLLDPELPDGHVPRIDGVVHHVVRLRDQEHPGKTGHFPDLIADLFERMRHATQGDDSRILVHCHAGVSRSTAFTYALIAERAGHGQEEAAFAAFMSLVNKPWPNRRIVEIIDELTDRRGALLAPLDRMRARHPRRIQAWDRFNEKRGLFDLYGRYGR